MHTVHPWIKKTHQHASLILRDPVLGPLTCCPQRWFAEKPRNDAIIAGFMRTKSQWAQWQLHSHVTEVLALPLISPTGRYFHFALLSHFWSSSADRVMLHFLYLIYLLTLERRFVLTKIAPKRIFSIPKILKTKVAHSILPKNHLRLKKCISWLDQISYLDFATARTIPRNNRPTGFLYRTPLNLLYIVQFQNNLFQGFINRPDRWTVWIDWIF